MSFRSEAEPLYRLCEKLGAATKLKVKAEGDAATEVVLLKATDKPLRVLLDKVASASWSKWHLEDQEVVFRRDEHLRAAMRERDIETTLRGMDSQFQRFQSIVSQPELTRTRATSLVTRYLSALKTNPDEDGSDRAAHRILLTSLADQKPASRLIARLMLMLDSRKVAADLTDGLGSVYSTAPGKAQFGFKRETSTALKEYVSGRRTLLAAAKEGLAGSGDTQVFDRSVPDKVTAVLYVGGFYLTYGTVYLTARVQVVDGRGKIIDAGSITIDGSALRRAALAKITPIPAGKPIDAPEDIKKIAPIYRRLVEEKVSVLDLPPGLQRRVLDPATFEPLAGEPSFLTLQLADQLNKDVSANLTDECSLFGLSAQSPIKPSTIHNALHRDHRVSLDESWLTIAPYFPDRASKSRLQRKRFGGEIQRVFAEKTFSALDQARFWMDAPFDILGFVNHTVSAPLYDPSIACLDAWEISHITQAFAALGSGHLRTLLKGGTIAISALPIRARESLERHLFRTGYQVPLMKKDEKEWPLGEYEGFDEESTTSEEEETPANQLAVLYDSMLDVLVVGKETEFNDASFLLKGGLSRAATVQVQHETSPTLFVVFKDSSSIEETSPESIALGRVETEYRDDYDTASYYLGETTLYRITILMPEGYKLFEDFGETRVTSRKPTNYEQLPKTIRDQVERAEREYRSSEPPPRVR